MSIKKCFKKWLTTRDDIYESGIDTGYRAALRDYNTLENRIRSGKATYTYYEVAEAYYILGEFPNSKTGFLLKVIQKGNDSELARVRAEELCKKLNEY